MFDYSILYEQKLNFTLDAMSIDLESLQEYNPNSTIILIFGYPELTPAQGL